MSRKLLAGSLVAGAAIIALALRFDTKPIYAYRVGDFLSRDLREQEVRVQGLLVRGSLCKVEEGCGYRFALSDVYARAAGDASSPWSRPSLALSYDGCVIPDTFRDVPGYEITATVQGERCQSCHDFKATQVIAKCPSKYEMRSEGGVHLPASPIPPCSALKPRM